MVPRVTLVQGFNGKKFTLFRWTGEKRSIKKGEYFLSGAIPDVYLAFNDMTGPYYIMEEAKDIKKRVCLSGIWYDLSNNQGGR